MEAQSVVFIAGTSVCQSNMSLNLKLTRVDMVALADFQAQVKSDTEMKNKWVESFTIMSSETRAREFRTASASDGIRMLLSYKRRATVLNEMEWQECFQAKPKVRDTRKVPQMEAPSLQKVGQKETVLMC